MPSLLATCTDSNKVVNNELSVTYRLEPEKVGSKWVVVRTATKNYEYVGLTKAAAMMWAAAKRAQYFRHYWYGKDAYQDSDNFSPTIYVFGTAVMRSFADIATQHVGGDAWKVSISLNEEDKFYVALNPMTGETSISRTDMMQMDFAELISELRTTTPLVPFYDPYYYLALRSYDQDDGFKITAWSLSTTLVDGEYPITLELANIPASDVTLEFRLQIQKDETSVLKRTGTKSMTISGNTCSSSIAKYTFSTAPRPYVFVRVIAYEFYDPNDGGPNHRIAGATNTIAFPKPATEEQN